MRTSTSKRALRRGLIGAGAILVAAIAAGIGYASVPDTSGVIHGCYQKSAGALRVIDPSNDGCRSSELPLAWNQTGPTGPRGTTGEAGTTGAAGPVGAPGAAGPVGPSDVWAADVAGPVEVATGVSLPLFDLPSGNFLIQGSALLFDPYVAAQSSCVLRNPNGVPEDGTGTFPTQADQPATVTLQFAGANVPAGTWRMKCSSDAADTELASVRFSAIEVGAVH